MSYTLANGELLSGLLGDGEIAAHLSVEADIAAMLRFEAALAAATADVGLIPQSAASAIAGACRSLRPDAAKLRDALARDGVAVPELVRQLRGAAGEPHTDHVHFGGTSQDVIDTSMVLRLREISALLVRRIHSITAALDDLSRRFGDNRLMGRTRMQAALPIRVADRIGSWRRPLVQHCRRIGEIGPRLFLLQLGGPAGTLEQFGEQAGEIGANLAKRLGLSAPAANWQTDRSSMAEFAGWLSLVTGSLGKTGIDICLMAQNEIAEIALSGSGGSSAMAHKQNPVRAEALVALARFNATLVSAVHQSLVHEQERSGAAWTLEWMALPQMCICAGASTRIAGELLASVRSIGTASGKPE